MKPKMLFLILFLFFRIGVSEVNAQNLTIRLNDGTESSDLLSTIQKLSFSDGNLVLAYKSGSSEIYGLSTVQKLYFDNQTFIAEYTSNGVSRITVYPNPVDNVITLQNIPEGNTQVLIYSIDGELLVKTQISSDKESIDVANLQSGFYLLIANDQAVKFMKL
jgi:hypothetical protein